jgi:hypothetical protein
VGLFKSQAKLEKQFGAAYSKWYDTMYSSECRSRGTTSLPMDAKIQIHNTAARQAVIELNVRNFTISESAVQALFAEKLTGESQRLLSQARTAQVEFVNQGVGKPAAPTSSDCVKYMKGQEGHCKKCGVHWYDHHK